MKTLVVVSHPDISASVINKRWIEELKKHSDQYTTHDLAAAYPDGNIDIIREQKLIEEHDHLVFQFPIFWFSSPPLLKQWFDQVLSYGWAYGRNGGNKLKNRKVALAVTAGIRQADYQKNGRYHYTLEELLRPFETTLRYYCHADYRSFFAFYGAEIVPGEDYASEREDIEKSAADYLSFLFNL